MKQAVSSVRWTWLTNKLDKKNRSVSECDTLRFCFIHLQAAARTGSLPSPDEPSRPRQTSPHRRTGAPSTARRPTANRHPSDSPRSSDNCRATGGSDLQRQIFSTSASPAVDTAVFFTPPAYRKRDGRRVFSKSKRRAAHSAYSAPANSFPRKSKKAGDGLHPLLLIFIALPFKRHISYSPAGSPGVLGLRRR